jgi:predicted  nucleic acid-binding Zn ribbon protein
MDTVQLLFRTRPARAAKNDEDLLDKVQSYLAALLHNGQIVGDHMPLAKISGGFLVTASLPEADALGDRFANKWVRKSLRELEAAGVDRPKVTHLGADPESRKPCRCGKRPFLVMFTTFLNAEPPLRCGACFGPVALYKVPATNEAGNHQDVLRWQDTYQAMDWLFTGTGPGERFAHDQLPFRQRAIDGWATAGARASEESRYPGVLLPLQALWAQRSSGAQTRLPFMRQGMVAQGASPSNLRLPVPALSALIQRGVRRAVGGVIARQLGPRGPPSWRGL